MRRSIAETAAGAVATVAEGAGRSLLRKLERYLRHLGFGQPAVFRGLFDDMAVAIAGCKIHPAVDSARIRTQSLFDDAHRFDEFAPVHRSQKTQAGNAVADRDLSGCLLLNFRLHHLLDCQVRLCEQLLDPRQRQCQCGTLSLQAARKFRYERGGHRRARSRHVRDHQNQAFGILFGDCRHLVRPGVGQIPVGHPGSNPDSHAPEIFDKRQPQHDGDCPQFA